MNEIPATTRESTGQPDPTPSRPLPEQTLYPPVPSPASDRGADETPGIPAPVSRAVLRELAGCGTLTPEAFEASLAFLGMRPGRREWGVFGMHSATLAGALFLAAGIVCFFAYNWAGMHHFTKFALLGGVLLVCAAIACQFGLDSLAGRAAVLVLALTMGPLMAVFGQTYQTGAPLWELFRAWMLCCIPLACVGRQAAMWLVAWVVTCIFTLAWMQSYGIFFAIAPEFVLCQIVFVMGWEYTAGKYARTEGHWLRARWLPRIMGLSILGLLTVLVAVFTIESGGRHDETPFFLPVLSSSYLLYLAVLLGGAYWYFHRQRDLLMLAAGVLSLNIIVLALIIRSRIVDFAFGDIFVLGLLVTGLTVGSGKLVLHLHRRMQALAHAQGCGGPEPRGFFDGRALRAGWPELWAELSGRGLLAPGMPMPTVAHAPAPWYINTMMACGGWVSAVLFMIFLGLFIGSALRIRSELHVPVLIGSAVFLGAAFACMRLPGLFTRQFGLASGIAGIIGACAGLLMYSFNHGVSYRFWGLICAAAIWASFPFMRNGSYRFLAAFFGVVFVSMGIDAALWNKGLHLYRDYRSQPEPFGFSFSYQLSTVALWSVVCCGIVRGWFNERSWIASPLRREWAAPLLHGLYTGMLGLTIASLIIGTLLHSHGGRDLLGIYAMLPPPSLLGVSAGVGLLYMLLLLARQTGWRGKSRWLAICVGAAGIALGYYLPGVSLGLLGLALSRYVANRVLLGGVGFFLFAYILYYYYNQQTTLLHKSATLMAAGVALLVLGAMFRRLLAEADAQPVTGGGAYA